METAVKSSKPKVRSALTVVVAICALLAFSASANAELGETVEAAAAPVEAVEAPVPPAEPEPVQAVETTPVAEEIQPVHVPPPPKPVEAEAPSVTEPADVQELAQSVGKGSAGSVAVVAKATKTLAQGSLNAIGSAVDNALPDEQLPGIAVVPAAPSPDGSLSSPLPPQSSGSLLPRPFIGAFPFQPPLMEFGGLEATAVGSGASDNPDGRAEARLSTAMETGAVPFRATIGGGPIDRSGNPAPLNVPPPAPGSPGTIASGVGGSLFIPLAALLALLALAAPAVLRRLWEVSAFRPLTPFVCALERPG